MSKISEMKELFVVLCCVADSCLQCPVGCEVFHEVRCKVSRVSYI